MQAAIYTGEPSLHGRLSATIEFFANQIGIPDSKTEIIIPVEGIQVNLTALFNAAEQHIEELDTMPDATAENAIHTNEALHTALLCIYYITQELASMPQKPEHAENIREAVMLANWEFLSGISGRQSAEDFTLAARIHHEALEKELRKVTEIRQANGAISNAYPPREMSDLIPRLQEHIPQALLQHRL